MIESVDKHHLNVNTPLKGSLYIRLPQELSHRMEGLINLKNKDNGYFRWCHIRQLTHKIKIHSKSKKSEKAFINQLNYDGIEFPVTVKQYNRIEKQNSIRTNVFGFENKQKLLNICFERKK